MRSFKNKIIGNIACQAGIPRQQLLNQLVGRELIQDNFLRPTIILMRLGDNLMSLKRHNFSLYRELLNAINQR